MKRCLQLRRHISAPASVSAAPTQGWRGGFNLAIALTLCATQIFLAAFHFWSLNSIPKRRKTTTTMEGDDDVEHAAAAAFVLKHLLTASGFCCCCCCGWRWWRWQPKRAVEVWSSLPTARPLSTYSGLYLLLICAVNAVTLRLVSAEWTKRHTQTQMHRHRHQTCMHRQSESQTGI